jgi:hypothetical protein
LWRRLIEPSQQLLELRPTFETPMLIHVDEGRQVFDDGFLCLPRRGAGLIASREQIGGLWEGGGVLAGVVLRHDDLGRWCCRSRNNGQLPLFDRSEIEMRFAYDLVVVSGPASAPRPIDPHVVNGYQDPPIDGVRGRSSHAWSP